MRALAKELEVPIYVDDTRETLALRLARANPERWKEFITEEHLTESGAADSTPRSGPHAKP